MAPRCYLTGCKEFRFGVQVWSSGLEFRFGVQVRSSGSEFRFGVQPLGCPDIVCRLKPELHAGRLEFRFAFRLPVLLEKLRDGNFLRCRELLRKLWRI